MSFSYRSIAMLLTTIIFASLFKLAFFAMPEDKTPTELSAQEIRQDLYALLDQIKQHSAFYALTPDKTSKQLNHMASLITEQYQDIIAHDRFAAEVTKLLNTMKDPGAQVHNFNDQSGDLPLTLRPLNDQWLALDSKNSPINNDFPFITHIDGLPMSKWTAASQAYLSEPAKQSQEMQLPWLKKLNLLRQDLGLDIKSYVRVTLMNDELQSQQRTIALHQPRLTTPQSESQSAQETQLSLVELLNSLSKPEHSDLQQKIPQLETVNKTTVKLKITDIYDFEFNKDLQKKLIEGMSHQLLIVDLRDASGFSPKLLTMLSRYQDSHLDHRPAPDIMGFAHYRRAPEFRNDYLAPLNFKPLDTLGIHSPRIKSLTRHLPAIDKDKFSPWFIRTKPNIAHEGSNRLILLVSPHCRQECEWIAHRTKAWSRVALIGEKTSGDFARQYRFTLPNSDLSVSLSSSLTYDAQGQLLSGVGTEPDIWLPQHSDLQWQGLVSLVSLTKPKAQLTEQQPRQPKLARASLN